MLTSNETPVGALLGRLKESSSFGRCNSIARLDQKLGRGKDTCQPVFEHGSYFSNWVIMPQFEYCHCLVTVYMGSLDSMWFTPGQHTHESISKSSPHTQNWPLKSPRALLECFLKHIEHLAHCHDWVIYSQSYPIYNSVKGYIHDR